MWFAPPETGFVLLILTRTGNTDPEIIRSSGTEAIAIAAGKSRNPKHDLLKTLKQIFWRILIVYVGMVFFVGLVPPNSLLRATSKSPASPFTIALEKVGWAGAGNLTNLIIVVMLLSSINSAIYVASRCVYAQAKTGRAPLFLGKTTERGVPVNAILFTNFFGLIALLKFSDTLGEVMTYLLDISGAAAFIAWVFISLTQVRMRTVMKAQGMAVSDLHSSQ